MMNVSNYFLYLASRGQGKTFLVAIFCVTRCVLYPGTQVCIAAGTKGQSINVLEKIQNLLMPRSPELCAQIEYISTTVNKAQCKFYNGSFVKVVTARDSARGNRANIFICDEFRLVSEDIVNTVLRRFLSNPRQPGYLSNPKYKDLKERNKEIYLSSAYFKNHWSMQKFVSYFKSMVDDKRKYFCCGLPYQLAIKQGLYMAEQAEDEMSESTFNEVKWSINISVLLKPIEPVYQRGVEQAFLATAGNGGELFC